MDRRSQTIVKWYVFALVLVNLVVMASQFNLVELGRTRPDLELAKEVANDLVSELQQLASTLGVEERSAVKRALAQLHYDVYLVNNRYELAQVVQTDASAVRRLIIDEFVRSTGDQILVLLNNSPEVQSLRASTSLTLEPLPRGGFTCREDNVLAEGTLTALAAIPSLFQWDYFAAKYESYRNLSTFQLVIEGGSARLATAPQEQQTIEWWEKEIQALRGEYQRVAQLAGFAETAGPGIVLNIYDRYYPISASDLRQIVGELFSSGATAISIDGQRLGVGSYIIDSDQGISVDGVIISTNPVVIEAQGDPDTLTGGVQLLFNVTMGDVFFVEKQGQNNLVLAAKVGQ